MSDTRFRVTIGNKHWRVEFCRVREAPVLRDADGACDSPDATGKRLIFRRGLLQRPRRLLTVAIHEALHAADWTKDETEWVEPIAEDIARLLWKIGFRLVPTDAKNSADA